MNTIQTQYTPEDLLSMEDGHRFDLVDGQLVERNMGAESSVVAFLVAGEMYIYVKANQLGLLFGADCGYQIFPHDPKKVRFPDGSFIARGRLPGDRPPKGHMRIAADLMLEVVSPNDLAEDIDSKVNEYLNAGVKLVWVFYPSTRTVVVYRPSKEMLRLGPDDELSGEDVLPGFAVRVGDLFPAR